MIKKRKAIMNTKRHLTITVLIAVMFFAIPAKADLSFYTDRSDWESAISGDISTETFDSVTPYFLVGGVNSAGLINIELVNLSEVNQWNSINNGSDVEDFLTIDGTAFYQGGRRLTDPDTVIHLHRPFPVRAVRRGFYVNPQQYRWQWIGFAGQWNAVWIPAVAGL